MAQLTSPTLGLCQLPNGELRHVLLFCAKFLVKNMYEIQVLPASGCSLPGQHARELRRVLLSFAGIHPSGLEPPSRRSLRWSGATGWQSASSYCGSWTCRA